MKPIATLIALLLTAAVLCTAQQINITPTPSWTLTLPTITGADATYAFNEMTMATDSTGTNRLVNIAGFIPGEFYVIIHGNLLVSTNQDTGIVTTNCTWLNISAHSAQ